MIDAFSESRKGKSLSELLKNYAKNFNIDLDSQWDSHAKEDPDSLTKEEAKQFMDQIAPSVSEDRGKFYQRHQFESIFTQVVKYDKGHLTRNEMALLIKTAFRKPDVSSNSPRN